MAKFSHWLSKFKILINNKKDNIYINDPQHPELIAADLNRLLLITEPMFPAINPINIKFPFKLYDAPTIKQIATKRSPEVNLTLIPNWLAKSWLDETIWIFLKLNKTINNPIIIKTKAIKKDSCCGSILPYVYLET